MSRGERPLVRQSDCHSGSAGLVKLCSAYRGTAETMMLTYRLLDSTLSIILPNDMQADIDEIEKNVISDRIDHNPQ